MILKYKNKNYNVSIVKNTDDITVTINENTQHYKTNQVNENLIQLFDDGMKSDIFITDDENNYYVNVEGKSFNLEKIKEEEKSFNSDNGTGAQLILKPPMPGSIVKIIANSGDNVHEGDPLIIIEAMKMETTLYSTIDGIVKEMNVKAGEQVDANKVLMVVDKLTS